MAAAGQPGCPKCAGSFLRPLPGQTRGVEDAHAPLFCPSCAGVWIPPSAFREGGLVERLPFGAPEGEGGGADHRNGFCPRGHGLMHRARVEPPVAEPPFWLERCQGCRGVWFDAGELSRTQAADLWADLDRLWDEQWQRRVRAQQVEANALKQLERKVGREAYDHLHALARLLRGHPDRLEALAWLRDQADRRPPR